jgi:hypothetical protein
VPVLLSITQQIAPKLEGDAPDDFGVLVMDTKIHPL